MTTGSDPDSWEANAQYLLDKCPFTVWQRPGAGPVDLKSTLAVTFLGMQMRLQGHPMFAKDDVLLNAGKQIVDLMAKVEELRKVVWKVHDDSSFDVLEFGTKISVLDALGLI